VKLSISARYSASITARYYVVRLIDAIGPSLVLVNNVLFMQARGLSQFQISCWAATYFLVAFLTDVPMGAFADAISRRVAYVLGCALGATSFMIYFCAHQYAFFIIAAIIGGTGDMLRNGAVDAWAVDRLTHAGYPGSMDLLFSRASQLMQFAGIMGVVIGGQLAMRNVAIPWLLGAISQVLMAVVAAMLMRGERPRSKSFHPREVARLVRLRMVEGIAAAFSSRAILTLGIANALTMAAWAPFWYEWPQFFNSGFHHGPQVASWIYCATAIATMLGAEVIARHPPKSWSRPLFMSVVIAAQSAMLLAAGLAIRQPWIVLMLFLGSSACTGIAAPLGLSWYNDHIDATHRATLLSFQSTCARLGSAMGLPIGGRIADAYGFGITWQILGALGILAAPFYLSLGLSFMRKMVQLRRAVTPRESS
jgi:MFS family permease